MRKAGRELELKFVLSSEQLERLKARPSQLGLSTAKPITRILRSTYYDTPDCALHRQGLTLRVRQVGRSWYQTVKAETGVRGGVSHPLEVETILRGRKPDLDAIASRAVRRQVVRAIGEKSLGPMFETVIKRTQHHLKTDNGSEVELAFDQGEARANGQSTCICEAEIELKSGGPQGLLAIVGEVLSGENLKLGDRSKSEIGYALLTGAVAAAAEPLKAQPSAMNRGDNGGESLEVASRSAVHLVLHNWQAVLVSDDPEAVHQMRVGLRRLRAVLQLFRPLLKNAYADEMETSLRDLAKGVSQIRDADVLTTDIVEPLEAHEDKPASLEPIRQVLLAQASAHRAEVRRWLATPELVALQLKLALLPAIASNPASKKRQRRMLQPAQAFAGRALAANWKKVAKQGRRFDELNDEERHELRKDLKALRYTIECCAPLYPEKQVKRFVKRLQLLQELFGYVNDVVMARRLAANRTPELQCAIGYAIGWHTAHAGDTWTDARSNWKKLRAARRFWE